MNEILFLVGGICIVGSSFYFANKQQKENEILLRTNKKIMKEKIKLEEENKKYIEIIIFDNDLLTQKTEKIEKLTSDLSFARDVAFARYDEIRYLRKKINVIRSKRLLKVVRAEKLGGVENV